MSPLSRQKARETLGTKREPCNTCRQRRIRCDKVQPICGRCKKDDKQCTGAGYQGGRLIIKDETQQTIKKLRGIKEVVSDNSQGNTSMENEFATNTMNQVTRFQKGDIQDEKWYTIANQGLYSAVEQTQFALFCCRETLTLKSLGPVMSEWSWLDGIAVSMQQSQALGCAIRANAANWLAKRSAATTVPARALAEYISSLKWLQHDLYDPHRQKSAETLFAVVLLGLFDIYNGKNTQAWQTHIIGACKIVECIGPEEFILNPGNPSKGFAQYVRGMDVIRAISQESETIFGYPEWQLAFADQVETIDVLFRLYGEIANAIVRGKKANFLIPSEASTVCNEMYSLLTRLHEWRNSLPSNYFDPVVLPNHSLEFDDPDMLVGYPYENHLEYGTTFAGHMTNLYRAAVLHINSFLIQHVFRWTIPSESVSQPDLTLAHEIVMSLPKLYKKGGIFVNFPARNAAKVLGLEYKKYIVKTLMKISAEFWVAERAARIIQDDIDAQEQGECGTASY